MNNQRSRGIGFERLIAKKLRKWFPDARRGLQYQLGENCPDIINTPFYIECKRGKEKVTYRFNRKIISFNPENEDAMLKMACYYNEKRLKWTKDPIPVVIIWKLDYKPICISIFEIKGNDMVQFCSGKSLDTIEYYMTLPTRI
jgi:hypothetical protein